MTQYYLPPDPTGGMHAFDGVVRDDGAWIPNHDGNRDWAEYQAWLTEGNTALPYPPEGVPVPAGSSNNGVTQKTTPRGELEQNGKRGE